jgi:hypothetical protein
MGRKKRLEQQEQQKKKQQKQKKIIIIASVSICVIALIIVLVIILQQPTQRRNYQAYGGGMAVASTIRISPDSNGDLRIPKDRLQNRLNYIAYGGKEDLIVWKDNNGEIKTALDTCEECYSKGSVHLTLSGSILSCSLCGTTQAVSVLGTEGWGGCRPISITPAMRNDTDTEVVLPAEVLTFARVMFSRWDALDFSVSFADYGQ